MSTFSSDPSETTESSVRPTGQMPVSSSAADQRYTAGRDVNVTWWYTFLTIAGMSLFLLSFAAVSSASLIASLDGPTWQVVVVFALFISSAVPCAYASWLLRNNYGAGWPNLPVIAALLAIPVLSWVVTVFIPGATLYGAMPLWIILSTLLPLIRTRQRLLVIGLGLLLLIVHGILNPGTQAFLEAGFVFGLILFIILIPTTYLTSAWFWHLVTRLDEARTINSELAVTRERLRFASDLHDIQGHHLQVIALKAELADRLLASQDPKHQQAAQNAISEVRTLAEEAQLETRQLVRDLRVVSLSEEVENAKGVLEAADITTDVHTDNRAVETGATETNRLLGFAVREATTNILRHASAQYVSIALTGNEVLRLAVCNDGADAEPDDASDTQGTGLAGLRQRFRQAGGDLHTHHDQGIFELEAILPAPREVH